jgi:hypothetical protein
MTLAAIARADVPVLCERLRALVGASDPDVVVCDVGALVADLVAVEALARLRLTARRLGCGLRMRHASRALEQMVAFCGLCDVLPVEDEAAAPGLLAGGNGRQPEQGEHPRRVEERVDRGDLTV